MTYKDLREFIRMIDDLGELQQINGAHWNLEIGGITEVSATLNPGPALLFENIKDYPRGFRVFTNSLNSIKRDAIALGLPVDLSALGTLEAWKKRLGSFRRIPPISRSDSPLMENSLKGESVDVYKFPVPHWHEKDGGRYIGTGSLVIMRDPESDWVNASVYRIQVHGRNLVTVFFEHPGRHGAIIAKKYWDKGKNCPVAIICGEDPSLFISGWEYLPEGYSEYDFAGSIKEQAIDVFDGPSTGLPVPAQSEILIEGEMPPIDRNSLIEGPFGEYTGYYASGPTAAPVVKIKSINYRNDPILLGAPPLRPPYGITGLPMGAATLWNNLERSGVSDVVGVWQYGLHLITVVSIKQRYSGHAKRAGLIAAGSSLLGRIVILVDEDIDPSNMDDVVWALGTRFEPSSSLDIIKNGWSSHLDPRISPESKTKGDFSNSKVIIDACKPFAWIDKFPASTQISPTYRKEIERRWGNLIFGKTSPHGE